MCCIAILPPMPTMKQGNAWTNARLVFSEIPMSMGTVILKIFVKKNVRSLLMGTMNLEFRIIRLELSSAFNIALKIPLQIILSTCAYISAMTLPIDSKLLMVGAQLCELVCRSAIQQITIYLVTPILVTV